MHHCCIYLSIILFFVQFVFLQAKIMQTFTCRNKNYTQVNIFFYYTKNKIEFLANNTKLTLSIVSRHLYYPFTPEEEGWDGR